MKYDEAKEILQQVDLFSINKELYTVLSKFLENGDLEKFEEVCRANHKLLTTTGVQYTLTDGIARNWYTNGQMMLETNYKNGKIDGIHLFFREDGTLEYERQVKNGALDGICRIFYKDGRVKCQFVYKNGDWIRSV